jgi:hypothetical protein
MDRQFGYQGDAVLSVPLAPKFASDAYFHLPDYGGDVLSLVATLAISLLQEIGK